MNPMPIVLENRGAAGGIRYINQFLARGLDLQLAPDAATEHVLGKASCGPDRVREPALATAAS